MEKIIAAVFITAILGGCIFDNADSVKVSVVGSTTVLPVVSKASEEYMGLHPNVSVLVSAGGSGVGVSMVGSGLADIGMISRNISNYEREEFNLEFNEYVIGKDAVGVMVSSEVYNSGVTSLTLKQLRGIYSGDIENWAEIGGPDRKIFVIDKEGSRGTRHVFMKAVFGDPNADAPGADVIIGSNNEGQTAVAQSKTAIIMLSIAWENKEVRAVGLDINGELIKPTYENIVNGRYPISRDLVLITSGVPEKKTREFIEFMLSENGQKIVEDFGYVAVR